MSRSKNGGVIGSLDGVVIGSAFQLIIEERQPPLRIISLLYEKENNYDYHFETQSRPQAT